MQFNINNTLLAALGIELTTLDKDKVIGKMPVDDRTKQILGVLHGGASAALIETLASIGSCLNIDMNKEIALGVELNCSHLKSLSDGFVVGEATPIRIGKSLHVWSVKLYKENDPNYKISEGRCSVFVKSK